MSAEPSFLVESEELVAAAALVAEDGPGTGIWPAGSGLPYRCLGVRRDGRLVGMLEVYASDEGGIPDVAPEYFGRVPTDDVVVVLATAAVQRAFRHEPIELELKTAALAFARERGASMVYTLAEPADVAAHRAMGFSECAPAVMKGFGVYVPLALDVRLRDRLDGLQAARAGEPVATTEDDWRQVYTSRRQDVAASDALHASLRASDAGRIFLDRTEVRARRGDTLIRRGEPSRALYLILEGAMEARIEGRPLGVHAAGEVVGEIGLLLESVRSADVVIVSDSARVLRLTSDDIDEWMRFDPSLSSRLLLGIARGVCWKLLEADERHAAAEREIVSLRAQLASRDDRS